VYVIIAAGTYQVLMPLAGDSRSQKAALHSLAYCALVLINEVNLRRARLVLGWMGDRAQVRFPGSDTLFRYVTSQPGRLSLLPSVRR